MNTKYLARTLIPKSFSIPLALVCLFFLSTFCTNKQAGASELVLVKDGVSQAPIVIFEDAPPRTRQAADELADFIERTSGAKPEILEGRPDPLPEHAIWVGYQPVLEELFPEVDFDFKHPEEILITANENHLVIAGRDRWVPEKMEIEVKRGTVEGVQGEYGTANAVYTFLQDYLDVRWLWPGELGIDVLDRKTIAFEPFEFRYHPQFRQRDSIFVYSALGGSTYGHSQDWVRFQRLLYDSISGAGGSHGFRDWWNRFGESNPEYFALQPDGTRSGHPGSHTAKMCESNPAVWEQWLDDVAAKIEANPNINSIDAGANDGWASGHCICEDCRAWDHPDGESRRFSWQGISQDYVAISDRHVTFCNNLARLLKERFPDRELTVMGLAYGHTRPAPIEARPADNVIISSVNNFLNRKDLADRGSPNGTTHREQFSAWGEMAENIIWRPNTGSPVGWQQGLPDVSIQQTMEDFRFIAEKGCIGIVIDTVWEHWATAGPMYYLMGQMAWNPYLDGDALMDDYYKRGFGPAAETMKAYWNLWDRTRTEYTDKYGYGDMSHIPDVYPEVLAEADGLLKEAAKQAGDGVYGQRVEFIRQGFEWTRLMMENMELMWRHVKKGGEGAEKAADQVRENWKKLEAIANNENYIHAINWGPVRPQTGRIKGRGLVPDA